MYASLIYAYYNCRVYNVKSIKKLNRSNCEIIVNDCSVYCIHVQITNTKEAANKILEILEDKCWIKNLLDEDDLDSYQQRVEHTVKHIVEDILNKVEDNEVSSDLGEYLVSCISQVTLKDSLNHDRILLAELWKEQVSGNPGFDFHTYTPNDLLVYGEAKYNATNNPYTNALEQIVHFIKIGKDIQEYTDLKRIFSKINSRHKQNKNKAFVASFSLNAKNIDAVFSNVLKKDEIKKLTEYPELYILGVEICH